MPALKLDELRWEDPPEPKVAGRGRPSLYPAIITELKVHQGQWALVAIGKNGYADSVKTAAQRMAIGGKVEAVTRQHEGNGLRATYARWLPDEG